MAAFQPFKGLTRYSWRPSPEDILKCCICASVRPVVGNVHDRMPALLREIDFLRWLSGNGEALAAQRMLDDRSSARVACMSTQPVRASQPRCVSLPIRRHAYSRNGLTRFSRIASQNWKRRSQILRSTNDLDRVRGRKARLMFHQNIHLRIGLRAADLVGGQDASVPGLQIESDHSPPPLVFSRGCPAHPRLTRSRACAVGHSIDGTQSRLRPLDRISSNMGHHTLETKPGLSWLRLEPPLSDYSHAQRLRDRRYSSPNIYGMGCTAGLMP